MSLTGWSLNPPEVPDGPVCPDGHFDCDNWHADPTQLEYERTRDRGIPTYHSDHLGRVTIPED